VKIFTGKKSYEECQQVKTFFCGASVPLKLAGSLSMKKGQKILFFSKRKFDNTSAQLEAPQ
jgi:hypothetical protein